MMDSVLHRLYSILISLDIGLHVKPPRIFGNEELNKLMEAADNLLSKQEIDGIPPNLTNEDIIKMANQAKAIVNNLKQRA